MQTEGLDDPAIGTLKYPLVVKPVDAYSSRGVRRADNREELDDSGVIAVLQKQVKLRKDALADFAEANRTERADRIRYRRFRLR